jgi:predicted transcriptional regulator
MNGKNWNSKTKQWSRVVRPAIKQKAAQAEKLQAQGKSREQIAKVLGLSKSRISELLKKW